MHIKKQLITLGQDGELALQAPNGSLQEMPKWNPEPSELLVYLVIDTSGSMAGKKLNYAKNGALDFANSAFREGYAVGIMAFNDDVLHLGSPTTNFKDLSAVVNRLFVQGGTNMAPAIKEAISRFESKPNAIRAMVIITDGLTSNSQEAINAAEKAKKLGITILTIGTDDADYNFLSRIASDTKLAKKVTNDYLAEAISDAAKLLPQG